MAYFRIAGGVFASTAYFATLNKLSADMESPVEPRRAICILESQPNEVAKGVVMFEQTSMFAKTTIKADFTGLTPGNKHGFHIH
jgi:Cu/Zn superoxide dismutase